MNIDWLHFTPWTSLAGGMLIGLAAALLVLFNGRIAGISGMLGGLLQPQRTQIGGQIAFVAGLLLAPWLWRLFRPWPEVHIDAATAMLVLAGLLVGFGTRLGSGCTSGHGVCGLARLSPRSLAATLTFMAMGFITVWLTRHVLA